MSPIWFINKLLASIYKEIVVSFIKLPKEVAEEDITLHLIHTLTRLLMWILLILLLYIPVRAPSIIVFSVLIVIVADLIYVIASSAVRVDDGECF